MAVLGRALFFAQPIRSSPNVNAAPSITPVFLAFDITGNAAPALRSVRLRFDIFADSGIL